MIQVVLDTPELLAIRVKVDLKLENSGDFYENLSGMIGKENQKVMMDFSRARFIDSSGVGTLLKISDVQKERGGSLQLYGLNRSMLAVFRLAGLIRMFDRVEEGTMDQFLEEEGT